VLGDAADGVRLVPPRHGEEVRLVSMPDGAPGGAVPDRRHGGAGQFGDSAPASASMWRQDFEPEGAGRDLLGAVEWLRAEVVGLALELDAPDVVQARLDRAQLLAQLDDYLLPRLRRMDAPVLAVVGGSTGAGKSTLVNSLVRRLVSRSGVLRPTTRSPVLVHHPYDSGAFLTQRILPGLARLTAEGLEPEESRDVDDPRLTALRLVPDQNIAPGLAIVDAPDIDSVSSANRELAVQLLAAADLWIFVTTAARYADALPWKMLRQAVERGVTAAIVLDRVPVDSLQEVRLHFATMLRDRGLAAAPLFTIAETPTVDGFLPPETVAPLLGWLTRLARDARARAVVVNKTLCGALDSLPERVDVLAAAADVQSVADQGLRASIAAAYAEQRARTDELFDDGALLRGEPTARWQEFVGSGEFLRVLDSRTGALFARVEGLFRDRTPPHKPIEEAVHTAVTAAIRAGAANAVDGCLGRWAEQQAGAALLAEGVERFVPPLELRTRASELVLEWQSSLVVAVQALGQPRRGAARALALSPEGLAAVLSLAALLHDESVVDGPVVETARVAARVLDAVFGAEAAALVQRSRAGLRERVLHVLTVERDRITDVIDAARVSQHRGASLRAAAAAVGEAR